MRGKMLPSAFLLVSCAIFAGGPARAAEEPPRKAQKAVVRETGAAGWRAFRDPETGKLREPTSEEAQALSRISRAFALRRELDAVSHPNGMTSVDLKDAFLMDIVAQRRSDGSLTLSCGPASRTRSVPPELAPEEK